MITKTSGPVKWETFLAACFSDTYSSQHNRAPHWAEIYWFAQVFDHYFGILQNLHLELSRNIIHNILRNLPFRLNRTGIIVDVDLRGVPEISYPLKEHTLLSRAVSGL